MPHSVLCMIQVTQVQYDNSQVTVMLASGETITGTKAIVTLPLALLKKRAVFFEPSLPPKKIKAIEGLGAGIIEKVCRQQLFKCVASKAMYLWARCAEVYKIDAYFIYNSKNTCFSTCYIHTERLRL